MTRPSEREATLQQGYAITQSKSYLGQWFTTLGGYIMPPIMLWIGIITVFIIIQAFHSHLLRNFYLFSHFNVT